LVSLARPPICFYSSLDVFHIVARLRNIHHPDTLFILSPLLYEQDLSLQRKLFSQEGNRFARVLEIEFASLLCPMDALLIRYFVPI
jgi:hypothetical protein